MPETNDADLIGEQLQEFKCRNCGRTVKAPGRAPFEPVECDECGTRQPVPMHLDHFLLREELGAGGMGTVYRAYDESLNRNVALKVMHTSLSADSQFVDSFLREARAAAAPNHQNIAQIYSFEESKGRPYIVMEFLDGGRLDDIMAPGKPLDEQLVLEIGLGIAEGLNAAHEKGIVHGDIKPANILFGANQTPKIVDFGLATFINDYHQTDEIWGTPYYIPPERVRRQKTDHRSDIYSLGATLYHALVGKPPFDGKTAVNVVQARLLHPPEDIRTQRADLHDRTAYTVRRMLEADPSVRYPTYESLLSDLRKALNVVRKERSEAAAAPKPKGLSPAVIGAIGVGAIAVTIGIVALAKKGAETRDRHKQLAIEEARRKREEQERLRKQAKAEHQRKLEEAKKRKAEAQAARLAAEREAERKRLEELHRKQQQQLALQQKQRREREQAERRAREAELALQQKTREEQQKVRETAAKMTMLVKRNAFSDASATLNMQLADLETKQAKTERAAILARYERLEGLRQYLIEAINKEPFKWGWGLPGKVDVVGAHDEWIRLRGGHRVPWAGVSLPQFLKFVKHYVTAAKVRPASKVAELQLAQATLVYEQGYHKEAKAYAESVAERFPAVAKEAERLAALAVQELEEAAAPAAVAAGPADQIPFAEDFGEIADADGLKSKGWLLPDRVTATVQDRGAEGEGKALRVSGGTVAKSFAAGADKVVWTDMQIRPEPASFRSTPPRFAHSTVAFYLNPRGQFVAYDGNAKEWKQLDNKRVRPETWMRITIRQDYGSQSWALFLNGALVADKLGFAVHKTSFSGVAVTAGARGTVLDQVAVTAEMPDGIDYRKDAD